MADEIGRAYCGLPPWSMRMLLRAILVCGVLLPTVAAPSGFEVWVLPSLVRMDWRAKPGLQHEAQLQAGRGEVQSFQIVIRSLQRAFRCDDIVISDLEAPAGVIKAGNVVLYREHLVHVMQSSPFFGGTNPPLGAGWYPDALIPLHRPPAGQAREALLPTVPFMLDAGQDQAIWVDVAVPRETIPGRYSGTLIIESSQGPRSISINLQVWHFTLPLRPSLKSSFGIWESHGIPAQEELLEHKLAPAVLDAAQEGSFAGRFGLGLTGLGFWSGAHIGQCVMSPAPPLSRIAEAARKHRADLWLYNYTADEIDACPNLYESLKAWALRLHQAGVHNLVTMKPVPELLDDGSGQHPAVDAWVLLPVMFESAGPALASARAMGAEVWSYNALAQDGYSPKWLIDYAPVNFRIQPGFLSQSLDLTGILYWRVDAWTAAPWEDVNNIGVYGDYNAPGEGMLLYPGEPAGISGVVPSMRLKWIRDGVDDYEYVQMLKRAGRGAWALALARKVGRDWMNWSKDPDALEQVRNELGAELDRLAPN
jgi:hypothetical protein